MNISLNLVLAIVLVAGALLVMLAEAGIRRRMRRDIILTHSGHDEEQDHTAVHWATMCAAPNHPAVLCFESPSITAEFAPSVFVDVNDYVDVKAAALGKHRTQRDGGPVGPTAALRGAQSGLGKAEGFQPARGTAFNGVL